MSNLPRIFLFFWGSCVSGNWFVENCAKSYFRQIEPLEIQEYKGPEPDSRKYDEDQLFNLGKNTVRLKYNTKTQAFDLINNGYPLIANDTWKGSRFCLDLETVRVFCLTNGHQSFTVIYSRNFLGTGLGASFDLFWIYDPKADQLTLFNSLSSNIRAFALQNSTLIFRRIDFGDHFTQEVLGKDSVPLAVETWKLTKEGTWTMVERMEFNCD